MCCCWAGVLVVFVFSVLALLGGGVVFGVFVR